VRSSIEIVAERRGAGTAVTRIRGGGHFAGRLTGPGEVYLVGTAAGPLGGDEVTIQVRVGPGARLSLRSAAATIVLPSADRPDSRLTIQAQVAAGGWLDLALEPSVICRGAAHEAQLLISLEQDGQVSAAEDVVLGRSGEAGGEWSGQTSVTRDGHPVLRHTMRSAILAPGVGAIATRLCSGLDGPAAVHGQAVQMPLAHGGCLATAACASLAEAHADLVALSAPPHSAAIKLSSGA
jgi:urease accessory protein